MSNTDINKNKIIQSLWLLTIIIVVLLLLSVVPEVSIGTFQLKKIDLLSDLRPDPPADKIVRLDSVMKNTGLPIIINTPNASVTPIEDFSGEEKNLMHFYKALRNASNRQVRIAFFGDSFIEGDIISASFRDTLQKVFGGNGVGLVPLASETAGFRKSISHNYSNWKTYSLIAPGINIPIGISGYTYVPEKNNTVTYRPGKVPPQKNFRKLRLFYQNEGTASLHYSVNDEPDMVQLLEKSDSVREMTIADDITSIELHIEPEEDIYLFGVSVEDQQGVYVDNFSMRRNSGIGLARLSPDLLKQFNQYLNYKLIILQYGLNVASETDSTNYHWYSTKMIAIIKNLKEVFPQTSFLLLSVSDRGINKDGKIITMEAIPKLLAVQRDIARKSGIAFWNLFEAMGGKNSIPHYTEAVPPLAAKDYTHLTHLGGYKIGKKLADALIHERVKYER